MNTNDRGVRVNRVAALSDANGPAARLRAALARYQESVVRGDVLDPVVTELVRLRCARSHDCRVCQSLRMGDAADAGVDDTVTGKVDDYRTSDLPYRTKLALAVTDAMIGRPGDLDEALVRSVVDEFTVGELAELCLDVTKWSTQKINVALGLDAADPLPAYAQLRFDEAGRATVVASLTGPTVPRHR